MVLKVLAARQGLSLWRQASTALRPSTRKFSSQVVEVRQYTLSPSSVAKYVDVTTKAASLRHSLVPTRLFLLPDTGGLLNVATHFYSYASLEERDLARQEMGKSTPWKEYLAVARPCMLEQTSNIFLEAPLVEEFGLHGMSAETTPGEGPSAGPSAASYEIRKYQLQLGYDSVPQFLDYYAKGLPSKLGATGTDPSTSLCTLLFSDVGNLNEVLEVWRHGNGTPAMAASRQAARGATEWREAIANIASITKSFQTTIHKPIQGLSPWE